MCINRITAWAYGGHNYDNERDAVWAAIDAIGRKLVKDYASNPGRCLVESPDLPKLLLRYRELSETDEPTTANSAEGTQGEEPEGTRARRIARIAAEMRNGDKDVGRAFLHGNGFENLSDFCNRATEEDMDLWDNPETEEVED